MKIKKDFSDDVRAKAVDLIIFPPDVDATNCANCKWVNGDICTNPAVDQKLMAGADNMCCNLWDHEGVMRQWQIEKGDTMEPKLPGGHSWDPEDFNLDQLELGTSIEMEHTSDASIAAEIAMDHLAEDPYYYNNAAKSYAIQPEVNNLEVKTEKEEEAHDPDNLDELVRDLEQFFEEEKIQKSDDSMLALVALESVEKDVLTSEQRNNLKDSTFAIPEERKYPIPDISHARNALARVAQHGSPEEVSRVKAAVYRKYPSLKPTSKKASFVKKELKNSQIIPIFKADQSKQIVYGVVLSPNEVDAQDDWMTSDDIEKAAHTYLSKSRIVGSGHTKKVEGANVVESYIAPQDFQTQGQYGSQTVKQGSWVLAVKILDPQEWKKVQTGEYTGFSVGGFGMRE